MKIEQIFLILILLLVSFSAGVKIQGYATSHTVNFTMVIETPPIWEQEIANVIVLTNSSEYVVDSDMSSSGNGRCTDEQSLTFYLNNEDVSKVDCTVTGNAVKIIPVTDFEGDSTCEVYCSDGTTNISETFTISVIDSTEPGEVVISGGGGGGGISTITVSEEVPSFSIDVEVIKVVTTPDETMSKMITITNNNTDTREYEVELIGLRSIAVVEDSVTIKSGQSGEIEINLDTSDEVIGVYSGELRITNGEISKSVLLDVTLELEPGRIPLELTLKPDRYSPTLQFTGKLDLEKVVPGETLRPHIYLNNFIEEGVETITLNYQVIDSNNQVIIEGEREIDIENYVNSLSSRTHTVTGAAVSDIDTSEDIVYSWGFKLSEELPPGRYVLAVYAGYGKEISTATQTFEVISTDEIISSELVVLVLITLLIVAGFHSIHTRRSVRKPKRSR
jgi:hypothetical protein